MPIRREAILASQILGIATPVASIADELTALQAFVASAVNPDPNSLDSPEKCALSTWQHLQDIRSRLSVYFTELARVITNNQAARSCMVDYGPKIEERLATMTALSVDAVGTSVVGGFRTEALTLAMHESHRN